MIGYIQFEGIYIYRNLTLFTPYMKKHLLLIMLILAGGILIAQPAQPLQENEPASINGIECTFRINQESTKKSGDNEFSRYVLEFYAINKSDCNKYITYRSDPSSLDNSSDNLIATFNIRNANGKRFTSKDAKVYAKPWWVRVKSNEKDSNGKEVMRLRDMQAGYIFQRGDQLKAQVTVLVPKGEKPSVEVMLAYIADN